MTLARFTAEASLYKTSNMYSSNGIFGRTGAAVQLAQLPVHCRNPQGWAACVSGCPNAATCGGDGVPMNWQCLDKAAACHIGCYVQYCVSPSPLG
jgi:hypothetical protein